MKKNNLKIVKIDKNKSLFNYEKKILIKELTLDLKLGYYDFEKEKPQKVKFSLEIDYEDKKPTSDKDIKSIVNYGQVVKLIKKLTKNKHYNFLETLAEDVFDVLFKDKRIGKIMLQIEKLEIIKELTLDLKLGYYDFEKEKPQKVKFSLEIDYEDKKPTSDKDIKSIVNYGQVVKLIKKLTKNKHYNFLETLAEDVFDILFKDKRIGKIMLQIEKLEILKECTSVGIQITKKRSHEKL